MICPMCQSPMWDNKEKKASGEFKATSPDFSCKNKDCHHGIWPEKPKSAPLKPSTEIKPPTKSTLGPLLKDIFNELQELRELIRDMRQELLNK